MHMERLPQSYSDRPTSPASSENLVSVVIPTYNRPMLLKRAVHSVLAQTYRNLEIIVVDDASSNNTAEIVDAFNDTRIRYIRHDDSRGGSAARNTGIRAATGSYIGFLDDDDIWAPHKIEEQLRLLDRFDAVLCNYKFHDHRPGPRIEGAAEGTVELDELRRGFIKGGSASALVARASVLKELLFDESLPKCQDWDLCIRIVQKYRMGYIEMPLFSYDDGGHDRISNQIVKLPAPQLENRLRMLHKHREFFGPKWFRRHMSSFMLYAVARRQDRMAHIWYVSRHYGVGNVIRSIFSRLMEKAISRFRI